MEIKDVNKIRNRVKKQIEEEVIYQKQEELFQSDEEDVEVKEIQVDIEKMEIKNQPF